MNGKANADDLQGTPLYLAAFTRNNLPSKTWGPRRRIHHYGPYAHLNDASNQIIHSDSRDDVSAPRDDYERYTERF